jgi:Xaa-Pro aminopeptidase
MPKKEIILLREAMQEADVQACIIPSTDPHAGEYAPDYWKTRQWVSGFTGSAGTVVITPDRAGLWTDSRYFLQAEEQLRDSGIALFKAGLPGTPSIVDFLRGELKPGDTVGVEGLVYTAAEALALIAALEPEIRVNTRFAPCNALWSDRPPVPAHPVFVLPQAFSGESASSKRRRLLAEIKKHNCQSTLLAALDSIAWLLNLRGNDIDYNPVAISYLFLSEAQTVLFISPEKINPETAAYLQSEGVTVAEYNDVFEFAGQTAQRALIAPEKINYALYEALAAVCSPVQVAVHPVDAMKAVKNETEIAGLRRAMQRDGAALVKFLFWFENQIKDNQPITELDVCARLKKFRSEQKHFVSESFETIAGYGPHGAIVHYAATPTSNAALKPGNLLLLDSGAQYRDGTTDVTRTLAVGEPVSDAMRHDFTLVLKGNIALSMAKFPRGTVGMQLDILARQFLWQEGANYGHGTGHGVGCFLSVHEGPQSIRTNFNPTPLQPGMVTSNEPGIYRTGDYGIRIENLLLTVSVDAPDEEFHAFETLTLCPIDRRLIEWPLLTESEIQWLDDYHRRVFQLLSPLLSDSEKRWLKQISTR